MRKSLYRKSINSKYHKLYWYYVYHIKKQGVKVCHRNLKQCWASFKNEGLSITIDSKVAGTLLGILILLHEYKHYLHYKNKQHLYFYRNAKFREKDIPLIWRVEWDCFQFVRIKLKKDLGYLPRHRFIDKKYVKNNILPAWIRDYC